MFFFLFIYRLRGGSRQKSDLTSVRESQSEMSVTTLRHVHRKTGNDSDSSTEHAVENEQKVMGCVTKYCIFC
jgi:hypothetical protein